MRKKITSFVTLMMLSVVTAFAADLHTVATMTVADNVTDSVKIELNVTEDVIVVINGETLTSTDGSTVNLSIPVPTTDEREIVITVDNPSAIIGLDCKDNSLKTLAFGDLENLKTLDVSGNALTTLDVTGLESLETLNVSGNALTTLIVADLEGLKTLNVSGNNLSTLDVSANIALTILDASDNELKALDVTDLESLEALNVSNNGEDFTTFTVNGLKALTTLDVSDNALTELNVSDNALTTLNITGLEGLTNLDVSNNNLTSLDVSNNKELAYLDASMNRLAILKLYAGVDVKLLHLQANGQKAVVEVPFNYNRTDADISFDGETQKVSVGGTFFFPRPDGVTTGAGFSGTLVSIARADDDRKKYDITFIIEEGVEVISANGVNEAIEGHNFQFGVLLSDDFADYSVKVLVDGEELLPFLGNTYVINNVDSDKEVTFILTKNEENSTSNETLTATSVSTTKGAIIVEAVASDVMIVSISGNVVYKAIVTGTETVNVAAGIYVVAINGKATKVVVR